MSRMPCPTGTEARAVWTTAQGNDSPGACRPPMT